MTAFDELKRKQFWKELLEFKISNGHLSPAEEKDWRQFIENSGYIPVINAFENNHFFPLPRTRELNKKNSDKKRTVFVFDRAENYILKAAAYYLNKYDFVFSDNLYSFRKNIGVKKALSDLMKQPQISELYSYKVDIHDYFNSVDTQIILQLLQDTLKDDPLLFDFISAIITNPAALSGDDIVYCKKGVMAGIPISGFMANLYLKELDEWFAVRNIIYARYSDDIIVFAETADLIAEYEAEIKSFLLDKKLEVNTKKEYHTLPGKAWEFLGFSVDGSIVDISIASLEKVKSKMRRKAKALVRWKRRTGACDERAVRAFIRHFNRKFYDNPKQHEVTWCRWYFPTITTSKSLRILDEYMISNIRYISTGKHSKSNFNLRYEKIKELGFRSLVNAYYYYKKTNLL